jgi:hypothetical protein
MFLHFAILNSLLLTLIFAHPAPHFENLKNFNGFEKAQRTCGYQVNISFIYFVEVHWTFNNFKNYN